MPPSLRPEHLLATILSSTEDGLLSFSLEGTIQSWRCGAERLYGYSAQEIAGQPIKTLLPIYELPACEDLLRSAKEGTLDCNENAERVRKDGARIRVVLKRAAVRDERGAVTGILETASASDWHAEGAAASDQLRLLVEQMPAILWTTDQNLRITSNWGKGSVHQKLKQGNWQVGRSTIT